MKEDKGRMKEDGKDVNVIVMKENKYTMNDNTVLKIHKVQVVRHNKLQKSSKGKSNVDINKGVLKNVKKKIKKFKKGKKKEKNSFSHFGGVFFFPKNIFLFFSSAPACFFGLKSHFFSLKLGNFLTFLSYFS